MIHVSQPRAGQRAASSTVTRQGTLTDVAAMNGKARSLRSGFWMLVACGAVLLFPQTSAAYEYYSSSKSGGNCRTCHGDFLAASYVSKVDGQLWGNLHDLHQTKVSNDCTTCHDPGPKYPNRIGSSAGGTGLPGLGCVGCHGRAEDNVAANPSFPNGYGAGLRRHHTTKGTTLCGGCHQDAIPASYTPVGENVLPPYYANPGSGHPNMPTSPCNPGPAYTENMAGTTLGLDNDGDGLYDMQDPDCSCAPTTCVAAGKDCGTISDGCGATLDCGGCGASESCVANLCVAVDAGSDAAEDATPDAPQDAFADAGGDALADGSQDAAGGAPDAAADAGLDGAPDAVADAPETPVGDGAAADGGDAAPSAGAGGDDDGGCGCRLVGRQPARSGPFGALAAALALLGAAARRRMRRRAARSERGSARLPASKVR
jgi:hypothetical protein